MPRFRVDISLGEPPLPLCSTGTHLFPWHSCCHFQDDKTDHGEEGHPRKSQESGRNLRTPSQFSLTHPRLCQLLPKDKHLAQSQEAWIQGLPLPLDLLCDLWLASPLSGQRQCSSPSCSLGSRTTASPVYISESLASCTDPSLGRY